MKTLSLVELKQSYKNVRPQGHWFDKETMNFFKSKIHDEIFKVGNKIFFISSEKRFDDKRKYTIRVMDNTGDIESINGFQAYNSLVTARNDLNKILTRGVN